MRKLYQEKLRVCIFIKFGFESSKAQIQVEDLPRENFSHGTRARERFTSMFEQILFSNNYICKAAFTK